MVFSSSLMSTQKINPKITNLFKIQNPFSSLPLFQQRNFQLGFKNFVENLTRYMMNILILTDTLEGRKNQKP